MIVMIIGIQCLIYFVFVSRFTIDVMLPQVMPRPSIMAKRSQVTYSTVGSGLAVLS